MKRIASLVAALLATLVLAASVSAGPSGSITLDQTNVSAGDTITFTTSGGSYLNVICHRRQGHEQVYGQGGSVSLSFTLNFVGAADCRANLLTDPVASKPVLDSVRFSVYA